MNGLRPGDEEYQPFNRPSVNAKHAEETARQLALEKRRKHWASARFARTSLDGCTEPWARKLAAEIDAWDAGRDPTRDAPQLMFKGDRLVNAGASDVQIAALEVLTNDEIAALRIRAAAVREDCRIQAREAGQSLAVARRNVNPVRDRWMTLDQLAQMPEPTELIPSLIGSGTLERWVGMSGCLKSFLALDAALSLATATPFLGARRFKVEGAEPVHVIYVVGEGLAGINDRVHGWCQERGIARSQGVKNVTFLNGAAQLASDVDMADIRAMIEARGTALIIFDTQARCTVGLEEDSATAQGLAIAKVTELVNETGVTALLLHHTPKSNPEVGRGTIAWTNALDTEWAVLRPNPSKFAVRLENRKCKNGADGHAIAVTANKVDLGGGRSTLVLQPEAVDPSVTDVDLTTTPIEDWNGVGANFAVPMLKLAQANCIPGVGLTQARLAKIAAEVVREYADHRGRHKKERRVCSDGSAISAIKLLVKGEKLVVARVDNLQHTYWQPKDEVELTDAERAALQSTEDAARDADGAA
ncbi:AAA family ATPase [Mycolicibacterium sp.]|uniref:AAA family ATPase n=1 Tax=Mycolicibacterium sp. TaxID=2320850 RepID=UPI003D104EB3